MQRRLRLHSLRGLVLLAWLIIGVEIRAADSSSDPDRLVLEGQRVMLFVDIGGGSPPFTYQWSKNNTPVPGATNSTFVFASIQAADAGAYTVTVSNAAGSSTSDPEVVAVKTQNRGRIANLSIQAPNGETLLAGFTFAGGDGSAPAQLLARAAGPSLAQFGLAGTLPDPVLALLGRQRVIVTNDNWNGDVDVVQAAATVGAFPFLSSGKDAALIVSLDPGTYTAQVSDATGAVGRALLEFYDISPSSMSGRPRLINVSARGLVGADTPLIAGFTIDGETSVTLLLRGVGPALAQLGIGGALRDPRLRLFRGATLISANDNWSDQMVSLTDATTAVGAFSLPAKSLDAAFLVTLEPGSYTAQVESADATSGVALMEIYAVPP